LTSASAPLAGAANTLSPDGARDAASSGAPAAASNAEGESAPPNGSAHALDYAEPSSSGVGWRNVFTVADQAVVSLGSFGTNILLVRSLAPAQYGAFALLYGVLLFLNNLHASLITYPLTVRGAAGGDDHLRRLAGVSVILTALLSAPLSLVVVGASWAVGALSLAPWVVLALLLWQVQETTRRALMAHLRYGDACWGDALRYLGHVAIVFVLARSGTLSLRAVFLWMAATSALGAIIQAVQLRLSHKSAAYTASIARSYWDLGRWMTFANLVNVTNVQVIPWALRVFHGLAEAAKLQALGQVVAITHPLVFSINNLIIPATARINAADGKHAAVRSAMRYAAIGAAVVIPLYCFVALAPQLVLSLFFGKSSPYVPLHAAMQLFALLYSLTYAWSIVSCVLSGLEKSRAAFAAQMAAVVVTVIVTLPLAAWGGVTWALVGASVSMLAGLAAGALLLKRYMREPQSKTPPTAVPAAAVVLTATVAAAEADRSVGN